MATIIATAVQGNKTATFVVPAGNPTHITLDLVSAVFPTDPTLTFDFVAEESFDGGVTFSPYLHTSTVGGLQGQPIGKFGAPVDGLWHEGVQWDGLARTLKVTITVNTPFSWGLTAVIAP